MTNNADVVAWDEKKAHRLCSYDTKLLHSLIDELVSVTEINIIDIKKAIAVGNMQQVFILAHTIKGSAACVYATKLAQAATSLENCVSRNSADQTRQRVFLSNIEDRYYEFCAIVYEKGYANRVAERVSKTLNHTKPTTETKKSTGRKISWSSNNEVLEFEKTDSLDSFKERLQSHRKIVVAAEKTGGLATRAGKKNQIVDLPSVLQQAWEASHEKSPAESSGQGDEKDDERELAKSEVGDVAEYMGAEEQGSPAPEPPQANRNRSVSPPPQVAGEFLSEISTKFKDSMGISSPIEEKAVSTAKIEVPDDQPPNISNVPISTSEIDLDPTSNIDEDEVSMIDFNPEDDGLISNPINTSEESFLAFQIVSKLCDAALMFVGTQTMLDVGRESLKMAQLIHKDVEYSGLLFPEKSGRLALLAASTRGKGDIGAERKVEIESHAVSGVPRRAFEKNSMQIVEDELAMFSFCSAAPVVRVCFPLTDNNGVVHGVWDIVASSKVINKADILSSFMFGCALILVSCDHIKRGVSVEPQTQSRATGHESKLSDLYKKSCQKMLRSASEKLSDVATNVPKDVAPVVHQGATFANCSSQLLQDTSTFFENSADQRISDIPAQVHLRTYIDKIISDRFNLVDESCRAHSENLVPDDIVLNVAENDLGLLVRLITEIHMSLSSVMVSYAVNYDLSLAANGSVPLVVRCIGVILDAATLESLEKEALSLPGISLALTRTASTFSMRNTQVGDFLGLECVLNIGSHPIVHSESLKGTYTGKVDSKSSISWQPVPSGRSPHIMVVDNSEETRPHVTAILQQYFDRAQVSSIGDITVATEMMRGFPEHSNVVAVVRVEADSTVGLNSVRVIEGLRVQFPRNLRIVGCLNHRESVDTALMLYRVGADVVVGSALLPSELVSAVSSLVDSEKSARSHVVSWYDLHIGLGNAMGTSLRSMPTYVFQALVARGHEDFFKDGFEVSGWRSIMVCTRRDSNDFSEKEPSDVFGYCNRYLNVVLNAVRAHGGLVANTTMNGIISIFPSAHAAMQAGVEILTQMKVVNGSEGDKAARYEPTVVFHLGDIGVGLVKDDVASMHMVVASDAVALCNSLAGMAVTMSSSMLVSGPFFNALGTAFLQENKSVDYRPLGSLKLNGRKEGIAVYDFYSLASAEVVLQRKTTRGYVHEGVAAMTRGNYPTAIEKFSHVMQATPGDAAIDILLKLVRSLQDSETVSENDPEDGIPMRTRQVSTMLV